MKEVILKNELFWGFFCPACCYISVSVLQLLHEGKKNPHWSISCNLPGNKSRLSSPSADEWISPPACFSSRLVEGKTVSAALVSPLSDSLSALYLRRFFRASALSLHLINLSGVTFLLGINGRRHRRVKSMLRLSKQSNCALHQICKVSGVLLSNKFSCFSLFIKNDDFSNIGCIYPPPSACYCKN